MKSHLELLRNEHLELQRRFADLQKRYDILEASKVVTGEAIPNDQRSSAISFTQRIVETVAHLYDRDLYSDITIHVNGHQLRGHRFVLAARTDFWGDLSSVDRIELEGLSFNVGTTIMKWIYTDHLELDLGTDYLIEILAAALKYRLQSLNFRCESLLINRLDIDNCVKIYQFAENSNLEKLRDYCAQLVAARWDEFKLEHFREEGVLKRLHPTETPASRSNHLKHKKAAEFRELLKTMATSDKMDAL
uniref:BTB domain-containing protein n=1 Tax=Acrobeloides nanus TaxID=290746 RepID=A0A914CY82_9BILA